MIPAAADHGLLLGWIVGLEGEDVVLRGPDGVEERATLAPPLRPLTEGDWCTPVVAMLTPERGPLCAVVVLPPPSRSGLPATVIRADDQCPAALENLVNQIAHDVRNYAFAMGLQAEMGMRRIGATPDVVGNMEAVLRQVDKLKVYLDTLLLYGRPVTLDLASFDVTGLIREEIQRFRFSVTPSSQPADIALDADHDLGPVRWDRIFTTTVLRILLDNALKSASPPPPITITVRPDASDIVVTVADRGSGIPEDRLPRIFEPMAVRRAGGTGLGMAICRKMAAAHGGSVTVSTSPSGTTVQLRLPREAPAA